MGSDDFGSLLIFAAVCLLALWFFAPDAFFFLQDEAVSTVKNLTTKNEDNSSANMQFEGLTVANWNLQVFGPSKASDPTLMDFYVDVIDQFDIVFVQEIRDAEGKAFPQLCFMLAQEYDCLISTRAGRTSSKEQYGVIYKKGINLVNSDDYNPDELDRWERPPIKVDFSIQKYNLTVYNIHTKPSDVQQELNYLEDVVVNKGNVIIIGDLNADCNYYNNFKETEFDNWHWIVKDDDVTNTAAVGCAYDRILMNDDSYAEYMDYGIYSKNIETDVSDHYLVWVELNATT